MARTRSAEYENIQDLILDRAATMFARRGYAATSICCKPISLFGYLPVPFDVTGSDKLMKQLFSLHEAAAIGLAVLICGHIGMAFYHRFKARDGVFERMV